MADQEQQLLLYPKKMVSGFTSAVGAPL